MLIAIDIAYALSLRSNFQRDHRIIEV